MLLTVGYGGVAWPVFIAALQQAEVGLVADCRRTPWSKSAPCYRLKELAQALPAAGIGYLHAGELGNVVMEECQAADSLDPYRRHLAQHPEALERLLRELDQGRRVALLCGCPRPDQCHRGVIAREVQQLRASLPIQHLRLVQGEPRPGPAPRILGLTLQQPWAWAVAAGHKRVESRLFAPSCPVGTYLAIHAGQSYDAEGAVRIRTTFGLELPQDTAKGAIVAVARLAGVVEESQDPWFDGPIGWLFDQQVVAIEPVPCKGGHRLWRLPDDVLALVRERWRTRARR